MHYIYHICIEESGPAVSSVSTNQLFPLLRPSVPLVILNYYSAFAQGVRMEETILLSEFPARFTEVSFGSFSAFFRLVLYDFLVFSDRAEDAGFRRDGHQRLFLFYRETLVFCGLVRRDFTRRFCWFTSCWAMRSLLCRSCLHVFGLVVLLFKKLFRNKLRGILLHFVKLDLKRQAFSALCFHLQLCMLCVVFIFRQCCILFRRLSKLFSHLSFHLNDLSQLSIQLEFLLNEML